MASERVQRRIERLLDQIEQESDQENWQRVLDLVEKVLGFDSGNRDAAAFKEVAERRLSSTEFADAHENIQSAPSLNLSETSHTIVPPSFASGRYQVKRFLGEGDKKSEVKLAKYCMFVTLVVKAEHRNAFLEASKEDGMIHVRDEPLCYRYDLLEDVEVPNRFYVYEVYETAGTVEEVRKTDHYLQWRAKVADWLEAPPERVLSLTHFPSDAGWAKQKPGLVNW